MIKVIEQSTSERNDETCKLFHQIKPFLDEGLSYNKAFVKAGLFSNNHSWRSRKWSRDVVGYAVGQGYPKG